MLHQVRFLLTTVSVALALAIVACGGGGSHGGTATPAPTPGTPQPTLPTGAMRLTSSAFRNDGKIPQLYTCEGSNQAPPLAISDVPTTAVSLALTVFDLDAGIAHWLVWNLPPTARTLPDDIKPPVLEGQAFPSRIGYFGPCPPSGKHHYVFTLYALDTTLSLDASSLYGQLIDAMQGHIVEAAQLTGTYGK